MRPAELNDMLSLATRAVEGVDLDDQPANHDLMHTVDRLLVAGVKLQRHLAYHPDARIDRHGRCNQCARLLAIPLRPRLFWGDGPRKGCLFAPAVAAAYVGWIANYAMSIPVLGRVLWLLRRRGCA